MKKRSYSINKKTAKKIAKRRWRGIPKSKRSAMVPRNGGRKAKYTECPKYGNHSFFKDVCSGCGVSRKDALL